MAPHSSTLAWKIPWTEEPGGLQTMGSRRVGNDWSDLAAAGSAMGFPGVSVVKNPLPNAGDLGLTPGSGRAPEAGNSNPFQYSCLGNSMDRGALWAKVCGVTKSQTRLSSWAYTSILIGGHKYCALHKGAKLVVSPLYVSSNPQIGAFILRAFGHKYCTLHKGAKLVVSPLYVSSNPQIGAFILRAFGCFLCNP